MYVCRLLERQTPRSGSWSTYEDPLEVYVRATKKFAEGFDNGRELGDVVPAVALAGDVEVAPLVLGEPLEPVEQENVRVHRGPRVTAFTVVRRRVRVREPDAGRRFQEDHICHYKLSRTALDYKQAQTRSPCLVHEFSKRRLVYAREEDDQLPTVVPGVPVSA